MNETVISQYSSLVKVIPWLEWRGLRLFEGRHVRIGELAMPLETIVPPGAQVDDTFLVL